MESTDGGPKGSGPKGWRWADVISVVPAKQDIAACKSRGKGLLLEREKSWCSVREPDRNKEKGLDEYREVTATKC